VHRAQSGIGAVRGHCRGWCGKQLALQLGSDKNRARSGRGGQKRAEVVAGCAMTNAKAAGDSCRTGQAAVVLRRNTSGFTHDKRSQ